ncbi:uncharacterized protein DS421_19g652180 [Arachis hypogaea]|uniref:Aminotransferase-like plant mobile domain-containing protein n=1 Tax=Arachis hypogaea TaxID=3818 RepID=A0A6B9VAX7_ARAHY|nr:uncharacterized protein DS421_19g652180 [Arachis hypogaea]
MEDDLNRLYRLDGVAHIAGVVHLKPHRCISSMKRQHGMRLDDRIVLYLQMAGLYHLARLNESWFRLDKPLVSAFIERWRPETHTFHMPFGECTITLQDELLGVLPPANCIDKFIVKCTWFEETFSDLSQGADDETVRRYARAYIMMLLSTQLFGDKSGTCLHIRWLPYVARLEDMGQYSWGSAALSWLYRFPGFRPDGYDVFHWPLAWRWGGYQPSLSNKGPRVANWRLRIDLLQLGDFLWMLYSLAEVVQVVHPEILDPRHMTLWRATTALIYFAVIEWHPVDRVLPQFGGVQGRPRATLNIDFLMSKDGRGRDRWFPLSLQSWHMHWSDRAQHVLQFDIVPDPGPSHEYLDWWYQHGRRFLSPELLLGDPRRAAIPAQVIERVPGRRPEMDQLPDVLENRRVARRQCVGTRSSQREWIWLEEAIDVMERRGGDVGGGGGDGDDGGPDDGHSGGDGIGDAGGSGGHSGGGGGGGVGGSGGADIPGCDFGDYFTGVPACDDSLQEHQPYISHGQMLSDLLGSESLDVAKIGPKIAPSKFCKSRMSRDRIIHVFASSGVLPCHACASSTPSHHLCSFQSARSCGPCVRVTATSSMSREPYVRVTSHRSSPQFLVFFPFLQASFPISNSFMPYKA